MARAVQDPSELIEVVWADTGDRVSIPRRLLNTGNKASQLRHLIATKQLPDPEAPPLPVMQEPEQIAQAVVDVAALQQVERRLQRLEQAPAPVLPSEESLAQWAMAAQRVGLSHAELASLQEQTTRAIEATAQAADARLGELDAKQAALASTISESLSSSQEAVAAAVVNLEQQGAATLVGIEEQAAVEAKKSAIPVAREVAALEAAKHWGSSVTIVTEDPREVDWASFAKRWYGRDFLIPGDGAFVLRKTGALPVRFTGRDWVPAAELETKIEQVNAQISAVNTGNTVFTMQNMGGAGGSGSGGDPLMVRSVGGASGGSFQLADASRWAIPLKVQGFNTPTAAKMAIQLTAADGPMAGKNLFLVIGILYEPGSTPANNTRFSEYSVLGDLRPNLDVSFTIQLQPAGAPGGVSVSVPAGTNAAAVYMSIGTNTTGATSFIVGGACEWLLNQDNVPSSARGSLLPAWQV